MTLEQLKDILSDGTPGYFATTNGEQLEVRGWQYQFAEENKFYFMTANTKNVYKQMQTNPNVAFSCASDGYNVRISGKATFVTDADEKEKAFAKVSAQVQKMYEGASNPIVEIFYIGSGEVKVSKGFDPIEVVKF
ncbi:pyridoxamine 5'-phosphate oxidase family protein [Desulfosporosinus sp. Sb-LF]|uniref:pyridoxamine 5'-phosphate oxidase family protein n=1 Tax=Desulfosporosinus sp. Sb-LF TaxID=2560027 RepID=UPI00107F1BE7|nr:pyridoxamine 5'-phosphate oxidase family protein [Desulfosporosinus sp. Sb-LF]TGE32976.1 pyridoxamine 5'-phosphate oxidase [Desulfosporosinus sp. Sb-LF]